MTYVYSLCVMLFCITHCPQQLCGEEISPTGNPLVIKSSVGYQLPNGKQVAYNELHNALPWYLGGATGITAGFGDRFSLNLVMNEVEIEREFSFACRNGCPGFSSAFVHFGYELTLSTKLCRMFAFNSSFICEQNVALHALDFGETGMSQPEFTGMFGISLCKDQFAGSLSSRYHPQYGKFLAEFDCSYQSGKITYGISAEDILVTSLQDIVPAEEMRTGSKPDCSALAVVKVSLTANF